MTTPLPAERLWTLWRRLKALYPMWSLPVSSFISPGALGMVGADFVSGLRRNGNSRKTVALLAEEPREMILALSDIAELNARRQDQVFKAIFILYVTLPLAVAAAWSDVAADSLKAFVTDDPTFVFQVLAIAGIGVGIYWLGLWRAKQIVSVLALIRIERGYGLTPTPGEGE